MNKHISINEAVAKITDGMTLMIGGFLGVGSPIKLIDALIEQGTKDLTIICNDSAYPNVAHGKLIHHKRVKKIIASHIGTNPSTIDQMNNGDIDIEFVPQGTLAERIRAQGVGLGGVLTQTGLGTLVAQNKSIIYVDNTPYLLEKPLRADIALIGASISDHMGNLYYKGTSRNMNPLMATAADLVIVEPQEIVAAGYFKPEDIHTSHIFIDHIIKF